MRSLRKPMPQMGRMCFFHRALCSATCCFRAESMSTRLSTPKLTGRISSHTMGKKKKNQMGNMTLYS